MKAKKISSSLGKMLGISHSRAAEAKLKALLISQVLEAAKEERISLAELARRSGLPSDTAKGILDGSRPKVTTMQVFRLAEALGLNVSAGRIARAHEKVMRERDSTFRKLAK